MAASKQVTWNGVSSSTIPELVIGKVTRQLLGEARGTHKTVPGREGAWFFPEKRGLREITLECFVEAASLGTDRRDAITAVADWADVETEARLIISDEPGVFYEAVLVRPPSPDEWREFGVFDLVFLAQPYALATTVTAHETSGDADFTETWDAGLEVPTYPVITVTPTNGTITSFELTVNGQTLSFTGVIADDQTITINSISAVVTEGVNEDTELTGAYDPNTAIMSGVSGVFPVLLPPSDNSYHFQVLAGTATAVTVEVIYRLRYRK